MRRLFSFFFSLVIVAHAETPTTKLNKSVVITNCDEPGDIRMLFPGGLKKAMTFSFDDGRDHDYKLVELMNKNGLRGTFHLCSGLLDKDGYVKSKDVRTLYANHEVASHTIRHANLPQCNDAEMQEQVVGDCKALEALCGYPVYGLAYPGGEADDRVVSMLPGFGIRYARVVGTHDWFSLPKSRHTWVMTCHMNKAVPNAKRFLEFGAFPALFSIWGHSYEYADNNSWGLIDELGAQVGNRKDVWYATNIEVVDYTDAVKNLIFSPDKTTVQNPHKFPVWLSVKGNSVKIESGKAIRL